MAYDNVELIVYKIKRVHDSIQRGSEFVRCTREHYFLTLYVTLGFLEFDYISGVDKNMHVSE
jgi:hypothetical protein